MPWAARLAVARCSNIKTIDHDAARARWEETTTSSIITKTQEIWLDRREQLDTLPVDSSVVAIESWAEEEAAEEGVAAGEGAAAAEDAPPVVVVRSRYHYRGPGIIQEITRRLEEGGRVYRVVNEMTREADGGTRAPLVAHIIYDRVDA